VETASVAVAEGTGATVAARVGDIVTVGGAVIVNREGPGVCGTTVGARVKTGATAGAGEQATNMSAMNSCQRMGAV
jgi:hypothetical protein